jgi:class 3 adenylate cyclase
MGPAFVAEIGDPRGRREFNVLGDTVNTAARLMNRAQKNQIIVSDAVKQAIEEKYECASLGEISLKGKSKPLSLYELTGKKPKEEK